MSVHSGKSRLSIRQNGKPRPSIMIQNSTGIEAIADGYGLAVDKGMKFQVLLNPDDLNCGNSAASRNSRVSRMSAVVPNA